MMKKQVIAIGFTREASLVSRIDRVECTSSSYYLGDTVGNALSIFRWRLMEPPKKTSEGWRWWFETFEEVE